jgi:hypothetical protein
VDSERRLGSELTLRSGQCTVNSVQCEFSVLRTFFTSSDRIGRSFRGILVDSDFSRGVATRFLGTAKPLPSCARAAHLLEGEGKRGRVSWGEKNYLLRVRVTATCSVLGRMNLRMVMVAWATLGWVRQRWARSSARVSMSCLGWCWASWTSCWERAS